MTQQPGWGKPQGGAPGYGQPAYVQAMHLGPPSRPKSGESGDGFALAGVVISLIIVGIGVLIVLAYILFGTIFLASAS